MAKPHPFDLTGRVAVVTGGANGIGAGITEILAEAGATVVIADIVADGARAQAEALRTAGHKAAFAVIDVGDESSIVAGCAAIIAEHGAPWILVNNAGVQDRELVTEGTAEEWDRVQRINVRGPFLMTRELSRAMIAKEEGGRIVNIGSVALTNCLLTGHAAYVASKGGIHGLSRATAFELAPHGITVNTLCPGGVITPGAIGSKGPSMEGNALRMPVMGMCEPRDIGAAALYFASPGGRFVTNQILTVDAGWSLS